MRERERESNRERERERGRGRWCSQVCACESISFDLNSMLWISLHNNLSMCPPPPPPLQCTNTPPPFTKRWSRLRHTRNALTLCYGSGQSQYVKARALSLLPLFLASGNLLLRRAHIHSSFNSNAFIRVLVPASGLHYEAWGLALRFEVLGLRVGG